MYVQLFLPYLPLIFMLKKKKVSSGIPTICIFDFFQLIYEEFQFSTNFKLNLAVGMCFVFSSSTPIVVSSLYEKARGT